MVTSPCPWWPKTMPQTMRTCASCSGFFCVCHEGIQFNLLQVPLAESMAQSGHRACCKRCGLLSSKWANNERTAEKQPAHGPIVGVGYMKKGMYVNFPTYASWHGFDRTGFVGILQSKTKVALSAFGSRPAIQVTANAGSISAIHLSQLKPHPETAPLWVDGPV